VKSKFLLGTDIAGMTAWHCAAALGNLEKLQKIYECAEEKLTTEELKSQFLLGTDRAGMTAWHFAADNANLETLQKFTSMLKRN